MTIQPLAYEIYAAPVLGAQRRFVVGVVVELLDPARTSAGTSGGGAPRHERVIDLAPEHRSVSGACLAVLAIIPAANRARRTTLVLSRQAWTEALADSVGEQARAIGFEDFSVVHLDRADTAFAAPLNRAYQLAAVDPKPAAQPGARAA